MKQVISKERLEASICQDSFYEFVMRFWDTVVPENPVWNWHIKYLCDEIQKMAERVIKGEPKEYDLIINISPGSTKSTICSVMLPAWMWSRMPTARFICGSYAYMLAMDLSRKSRMIIQSEKYMRLFPDVSLSEDQNTKGYFATTQGGGRIAVGTGGSITGFHAHMIVVDDPIDPNASFSEVDLKNADNWMRETLPTRKVDKALTPTILIMQRLHQDDPTGSWLARAGKDDLKHICLPAEIPIEIDADEMDEEEYEEVEGDDMVVGAVSPPELQSFYVDGLMDPVRLSSTVLAESERTLGRYGYAGQFLQSPIPRGGGAFKIDRILIDSPPLKWVRKVRYWDKAGTDGSGAYTAGVLMGKDRDGFFWILDVVRGQWDSFQRESIIKHTAEVDGKNVIIGVEQEPGSGGKESAENTLRNLAGWIVKLDRPTGKKETRADPFAVQVNGRTVRMARGEWNKDYLDELMYWPHSKYKDQVDASSGAFALVNQAKKKAGGLGR